MKLMVYNSLWDQRVDGMLIYLSIIVGRGYVGEQHNMILYFRPC